LCDESNGRQRKIHPNFAFLGAEASSQVNGNIDMDPVVRVVVGTTAGGA
jgi:hypothetical protein